MKVTIDTPHKNKEPSVGELILILTSPNTGGMIQKFNDVWIVRYLRDNPGWDYLSEVEYRDFLPGESLLIEF